jgi:hypothetical protein
MHDTLKAQVARRGIRDVAFWGRVTDTQRDELLQRSQVLCAGIARCLVENGELVDPTLTGMADKQAQAYQM